MRRRLNKEVFTEPQQRKKNSYIPFSYRLTTSATRHYIIHHTGSVTQTDAFFHTIIERQSKNFVKKIGSTRNRRVYQLFVIRTLKITVVDRLTLFLVHYILYI